MINFFTSYQKSSGATDRGTCTAFRPMLTDRGLCHSFNTKKLLDMYQNTDFMTTFAQNIFEEGDSVVANISGSGDSARMTFKFDLGLEG